MAEVEEIEIVDEAPQSLGSRGRVRNAKKDIDLSGINLPEYLKKEALAVYRGLGVDTHTGDRQKQVLFACFHVAGIRLNMPQVPAQLAKKLDLDLRKSTGASTYVGQARLKGLCKPICVVSPTSMIKAYLKQKKLSQNLLEKCEKKLADIPKIYDDCPLLVAAHVIEDLQIGTRKEICDFFGISEPTLRNFEINLD